MTLEEKRQHDKEISDKYLLRDEDITEEEYASLSIQDMCVLLNNAKWFLNSEDYVSDSDKSDDMKNRIRKMHSVLIQKIIDAPVIYSVLDTATGYPFITEIEDSIWIFSTEEYANLCVEHYREEGRVFRVKEIKKDQFIPFLSRAFFTNGVGGIFVDNGQVGYFIKKEYILKAPNYDNVPEKDIPVTNPGLMRAYMKFIQEKQWKVSYHERRKVLSKLENDLMRELPKAKLLIPTKGAPESLDAKDIRLGKNANTILPMYEDNLGQKALPAFTDWNQFNLVYAGDEYHAWAMDFPAVAKILYEENGFDCIVVNLKSRPLTITRDVLSRLVEVVGNLW